METLAGMGLTLILLAAVYTFQGAQLKVLRAQNVYADSQNVTRTVIDVMSRELRMATYGVKQGIIQATPTSIRFQQDLNGDGLIAGAGEDVTYTFADGQITRTDGLNAPVTLVSNVPSNGFSILYFDGSSTPVQLVPALARLREPGQHAAEVVPDPCPRAGERRDVDDDSHGTVVSILPAWPSRPPRQGHRPSGSASPG